MKTPEEMAEEYATATKQEFSLEEEVGAYYGFLAGYKAAMEQTNLLTPAKWISVKDRLPEGCDPGGDCDYDIKDYPYVLAHSPTDGIHVAYYDTHRGVFETSATTSAYAEELYKVTDWQPLPAPPKEDK